MSRFPGDFDFAACPTRRRDTHRHTTGVLQFDWSYSAIRLVILDNTTGHMASQVALDCSSYRGVALASDSDDVFALGYFANLATRVDSGRYCTEGRRSEISRSRDSLAYGPVNSGKAIEKKSSSGCRLFTIFMRTTAPSQLLTRKRATSGASRPATTLPSAWPSRMAAATSSGHLLRDCAR